jgi:hypothetical protein
MNIQNAQHQQLISFVSFNCGKLIHIFNSAHRFFSRNMFQYPRVSVAVLLSLKLSLMHVHSSLTFAYFDKIQMTKEIMQHLNYEMNSK